MVRQITACGLYITVTMLESHQSNTRCLSIVIKCGYKLDYENNRAAGEPKSWDIHFAADKM